MVKKTEIILPERIPILREQSGQDIKVNKEEFSLYYDNFIHPIYPWQDIVVICEYGRNLGHCYRITEYPQVNEFSLVIKVYDEAGELVTQKETVIELYDQDIEEPYRIICVGDSQTQKATYVSHMQSRLKNVITLGTRTFDGHTFMEGRAGWQYKSYFERHALDKGERGPLSWVSPFLFPKGIAGKAYFGDMEFYRASREEKRSTCCFNGFAIPDITQGDYYHDDGKLYRWGVEEPIQDQIEWEFSFKKYLERNSIDNVNAVSLLMGANDLYAIDYGNTQELVECYVEYAKRFVASIHEADENIDVIINLPVLGSEQYAFGKVYGCGLTRKLYAHNIRAGSKALIEAFKDVKGVYLCPMMCCLDTENNYDRGSFAANLYNDTPMIHKMDGIHPNNDGYHQMGDALAGVVEKLRHLNKKM